MIKKRYLINSSDERTWKFDRPVVFLNDDCCLYKRKHIWQNLDHVIADPYTQDIAEKNEDHNKVKILEKKFFPILCKLLNQHHGTQHDERFWLIVVGHWFDHFINLILNRFNKLNQTLQTFEITGITIYKSELYSLATLDHPSAVIASENRRWNRVLNDTLISKMNKNNIEIEVKQDLDNVNLYHGFRSNSSILKKPIKQKVLNFSRYFYSKIARMFVRDKDSFIISTYLPILEEIKLELALGQFPQMWYPLKSEILINPNRHLRKRLTDKISINTESNLEDIVRSLIFELLPVSYLEGFSKLNTIVSNQPWPKSPKFIFTSNNFHSDEVFKLYTANKVERGVKYFIGQHGSSYFTLKNKFPRVEEKIPDKFFTWGWKNNNPKFEPAFIFKTAGKKKENYNPKGNLILVETSLSLRLKTWDKQKIFDNYFNDQKKFIKLLDVSPKNKLIVRLYPLLRNKILNEEKRWMSFDSSIKLDDGIKDIRHLISNSRLVVHSYDSTGLLETLSQNIPTIAFWQNDLNHLREEVKPYYQMLIDAGIVHLSARSAAEKINEIWSNVDYWWTTSKVQDTKNLFCDIFAKDCKNPAKKMALLLKKNC